jgi:hypothetical protein
VNREVLGRHIASLSLAPRTRALLEADGSSGSIEEGVIGQAGLALGRVCRCVVRDDLSGANLAAAIAALAGLGPGLTPTGDDLLVGVTAAVHRLAGAGCLRQERLDALVGALDALPVGSTTAVSRKMLSHAARGSFPEPVPPMVVALGVANARPGALSSLVEDVQSLGSWSGHDMVAGVVALAREWLQDEVGAWQ